MRERRPVRIARPVAMTIDEGACIDCGACDELAPGIRGREGPVPVGEATLEAMAACPVGAIVWMEGETPDEDP